MKILVSDPITENGLSVLKDANFDVVELPDGTPEEIAKASRDIHGWVIRSGTKVTAKMIENAENLNVIARAGVGLDNIDIPVATRCGVVVMNTPDVNTFSTAEHTIAILSLIHI